MIHTILLFVYLAAVVMITSIHDISFYLISLAALILLARGDFIKIAKRAFLAIALFNSIITISYVVITLVQGSFSLRYVALINLRVFLLTSLTFLLVYTQISFAKEERIILSCHAFMGEFNLTFIQILSSNAFS